MAGHRDVMTHTTGPQSFMQSGPWGTGVTKNRPMLLNHEHGFMQAGMSYQGCRTQPLQNLWELQKLKCTYIIDCTVLERSGQNYLKMIKEITQAHLPACIGDPNLMRFKDSTQDVQHILALFMQFFFLCVKWRTSLYCHLSRSCQLSAISFSPLAKLVQCFIHKMWGQWGWVILVSYQFKVTEIIIYLKDYF